MRWSFQIASPFGIPVRVHASFALVLLLGALEWGGRHGPRGAMFGVLVMASLFLCVVLHELGHSLVARRFGVPVKQIMLLPIGGVAVLEGKAKRPLHELLIALAGPLVNVVIALGLLCLVVAGSHTGILETARLTSLEPGFWTLVGVMLVGNGMLAVFNMLPVYPLDGGRVLRAALASRMSEAESMRVAANVGQVGAVVIGGWALLSGQLILAMIAAFLFLQAGASRRQALVEESLGSVTAGEASERGPVVFLPATGLQEAVRAAMQSPQTVFPIALGSTLVGVITRAGLRAAASAGGNPYLSGLMQRRWLEVDAAQPLDEVLASLVRAEAGPEQAVAAVQFRGELVGFLSAEHILSHVLPVATSRVASGQAVSRSPRVAAPRW